jgi:hypothetical protein
MQHVISQRPTPYSSSGPPSRYKLIFVFLSIFNHFCMLLAQFKLFKGISHLPSGLRIDV